MNVAKDIDERAKLLAYYIIKNKSTVRDTAREFKISKSTVHKDLSTRLEKVSPSLAKKVKKILIFNKNERHLRGGMATKIKYMNKKELV